MTGAMTERRRTIVRTAAALLLYLAAAVLLARATWLHSHDDAYITYVFARGFAAGEGLTWNGAEGLGTTSPLLAVVLGSLERLLPLGVPVWGHLLAWTAIFLTACLAFHLGRREGWPLAGFLVGVGWLVSPATVDFLGGEYPVAVAFVTAAAVACAHRKTVALGVTLALAVSLRNEMGLAAVLLAAAVLARDGWQRTLRWLAPGAGLAVALWGGWLLLLRALAGTALPGTLAAKRAQAESVFGFWHGGRHFVDKALRGAETFFYPAGYLFFVALALLGLLHLARHQRRDGGWILAAALVLWGPVHLLALAAIDVPYYPWYSVPLHFSWLLLAALTAEVPGRFPARFRRVWRVFGAVALGGLFVANGHANLQRHLGGAEDLREVTYRRLAGWISERYPPDTRVATFEVGYLGYHGRFHTLDLLGLTTPETPLDAIRRGDFPEVVRTLDPDLVILPVPFLELARALVGDPPVLLDRYVLDHLDGTSWPQVLVYRRRGLEGRGEVAVDLLARASAAEGVEDGGDGEVTFRHRARSGVPALVLDPGESRRFELPEEPGLGLVLQVAPNREPPAALELRLLAGDRELLTRAETVEGDRWQQRELRIPVTGDTPTTLELGCAVDSPGPCLFGIPHLRR